MHDPAASRRRAIGALVAVSVGYLAVYAVRLRVGGANVDDHLYAVQTFAYLDGLRDAGVGGLLEAWRDYGSNTPLYSMGALPLAALSTSPTTLVLLQLPLILVLTTLLARLLGRMGVQDPRRWPAAAGVSLLAAVLSYAAMLHFALLTTTTAIWALVAYLESDRLRRRRGAATFGLALGLLALSRILAPVYVVAVLGAVLVDLRRDGPRPRMRDLALAGGVAFVVAAPWWITCSAEAWRWLTMGYDQSTSLTPTSGIAERFVDRFSWTASETGWLAAIAVAASAALAWRSSGERRPAVGTAVTFAGLVMVLLASSAMRGTAFALPAVVAAAAAGASWLSRTRGRRWVGGAVVGSGVLALVGLLPAFAPGERPLWVDAIPLEDQTEAALGCDCAADGTALTEHVARLAAHATLLLTRNDALLNGNGISYVSRTEGLQTTINVPPYSGSWRMAEDIQANEFVLAGRSAQPYHDNIDPAAVRRVLRRLGYTVVLRERLSAQNEVELWRRSDPEHLAPAVGHRRSHPAGGPQRPGPVAAVHEAGVGGAPQDVSDAVSRGARGSVSPGAR